MLSSQLPRRLPLYSTRRPLGRLQRAFSVNRPSRQQIHNADEPTFRAHLSNTKDKIILVDFYEDWCGPCKTLSPLLERIEKEPSLIGAQALDLITLKGESVPDLAMQYQIRVIPTVYAIKNGATIGRFTGALPLPQIKSWFASLKQ